MTSTEALKVALEKESGSIKLYTSLSVKFPEIRELLSFLIIEEQKHKKMIEAKIAEITRY
jgi:rubrerythrin